MRTTIDAAGRVVVPKAIRDEIGLAPGQHIDVTTRDGRIEIVPAPTEMALRRRGRGRVAVPTHDLPPLSADMVRDTLEHVRR